MAAEVVTADGIHVWLSGSGPPVLLLHGLGSSHHTWDLVAPLLERGHTVVRPDLPGHGASAAVPGPYSFEAVRRLLAAVLDACAVQRCAVVGHSWGAAVALDLAVHCPERVEALVLLDGGYMDFRGLGLDWSTVEEAMAPVPFVLRESTALEQFASGYGESWRPEFGGMILGGLRHSGGEVAPTLAFDDHMVIVRAMYDQRLTELYADLRVPALMMLAAQPGPGQIDWTRLRGETVSVLQRIAPGLRVERVPGGIHDLQMQFPVSVAERIARFLAESSPSEGDHHGE